MTERNSDARPPDVLVWPVANDERLESLDTLRGVAVLGILVMNIYAFAMPFAAYSNPFISGGMDALNIGTWFFTHILFDQKFMSIFSMLFGAGIVLMAERAQAKGVRFGAIFYRRQFYLLVIGLVHAYLIWFGDVLFFYAAVGMFVYLLRNRTPHELLIVAGLLLPVAMLLSYAGGVQMQDLEARADAAEAQRALAKTLSEADQATLDEWAEARALIVPGSEEIEKERLAYSGGYAMNVRHRVPFVLSFHSHGLVFYFAWRVGGLMLIGMALMKLGVFSGARSVAFYQRLMLAGYLAGLPLTIFSAVDAHGHSFDGLYMFRIGGVPNYVGSIVVALGHVGLVMLIVKTGVMRRLMARFAAVGRMALTNYLLHSIVMTSIFYGFGLGLYGEIPRFRQMSFVGGLIGLQLMLSPWWLARYRFGPAEWLWRSLTYRRRQPMRQKQ